jgi:hypothetical protein
MKTFVLTVSRTFPKTHERSGQQTWFVEKINNAKFPVLEEPIFGFKIHTIRANYKLWKKRAKQINSGQAVLSLRYWSGKPYNSPQVEFQKLEKIGIEKIKDPTNFVFAPIGKQMINWCDIAKNDGLTFEDFCEWFKVRDSKPMAVIHFTDFRYSN